MESQNADVAGSKKRGRHVVIANFPPDRTRSQSKRSASGKIDTEDKSGWHHDLGRGERRSATATTYIEELIAARAGTAAIGAVLGGSI